MNYIKEIIEKVLPVSIGEEFNIIRNDGVYLNLNPFRFTDASLIAKNGNKYVGLIGEILSGNYTIEKIPFVPKIGEKYYTYTHYGSNDAYICKYVWNNVGIHKQ